MAKNDHDADDAARDGDFQAVLKALLGSYRPFLESELELARSPEALAKAEAAKPPSCEDEIELGNRLFAFLDDEQIAQRILPRKARESLGAAEPWRWCLLHVRCCLLFGWLICRGPRTFRSFAYYVEFYWRCVRRTVGTPVHEPPTAHERRDLEILIEALAGAYKPFLQDQLSSVSASAELSEELLAHKVDCDEGDDQTGAIFERLLTPDASHALLGSAAIEKHRQDPFFAFCRCWCLCAMRFGCCLARARTLVDVYRCLKWYFTCLRECFRPLYCELVKPTGCVADEPNLDLKALVVPVIGSAAGSGFDHYTLEWSTDNVTFHATDFIYPPVPPGNPGPGTSPVNNGLLAYFDTTTHNAGTYFLRLTVFGNGATHVCNGSFSLFKKDVVIRGVDNVFSIDPSPYDPAAQITENVPALCSRPAGTYEMSFRNCLSIEGGAFVGGCDGRRVKRYSLHYKPGFETNPATPGWIALPSPFNDIEYATAAQQRAVNDRMGTSVLTSAWAPDCLVPVAFPPWCLLTDPLALLYPSSWYTDVGSCQLSGLITLRLTVEDTLGGLYYDTQRVWIDNKPLTARIFIDAVPKCADLFVSHFAQPPDCSVPWNVPLRGIAFDELIDEMLPPNRPNMNFDYYTLTVEKQGGLPISIPIDSSDPKNCCYFGTSTVGDPGTRCGVGPNPPTFGTLGQFDLRAIDPACNSQVACMTIPDDFTIERGTCCVYIFRLYVQDRSVSPCGGNWASAEWPVKICNDLK